MKQKTTTRRMVSGAWGCVGAALAICATFATTACSDSKAETRKKIAPICQRSSDNLANTSGMDSNTFMLTVQNALKACSMACDAGDDGSCTLLLRHVDALCTATPNACRSFCQEGTGSLKRAACEFKPRGNAVPAPR